MSAPPLPLGKRAPIEVAIAELGGKAFTVRRINGRTIRLFQEWQAAPDDIRLAWKVAESHLEPPLTPEESELLELDSVTKIIWLASADLAEVQAALSKGEGPATAPAPSSTTP